MNDIRKLTDVELRVLGSLIEKAVTTPDQYPLTLNALKNACNQKSNRHPVVSFELGEIGHAVDSLRALHVVREARFASGRAAKYEHRAQKALGISPSESAVLCVLMLRGPQTAGEIRSRSGRLFNFLDVSDVERTIRRLEATEPAPMVVEIPRQAGQKDSRYFHSLGESPPPEPLLQSAASTGAGGRTTALEERVSELERKVEALAAELRGAGEE